MAKSIQRISETDPYRLETIYSQPIIGPTEPFNKIEGLIWYDTNYISEDDPGPRIQLYVNGGWHIIFGGSGFVTSESEEGSGLPEVWIGTTPPPADSYCVWINPEGDSITPMNVERGGTGLSTIPVNYLLVGNGTNNMNTIPISDLVPSTRTINGYALSSDVSLNATDVNAYSLIGETAITENADLDNYIVPGNYYASSATSTTLSNCPVSDKGFELKVTKNNSSSNYIHQNLRTFDGLTYYRLSSVGVFNDWVRTDNTIKYYNSITSIPNGSTNDTVISLLRKMEDNSVASIWAYTIPSTSTLAADLPSTTGLLYINKTQASYPKIVQFFKYSSPYTSYIRYINWVSQTERDTGWFGNTTNLTLDFTTDNTCSTVMNGTTPESWAQRYGNVVSCSFNIDTKVQIPVGTGSNFVYLFRLPTGTYLPYTYLGVNNQVQSTYPNLRFSLTSSGRLRVYNSGNSVVSSGVRLQGAFTFVCSDTMPPVV